MRMRPPTPRSVQRTWLSTTTELLAPNQATAMRNSPRTVHAYRISRSPTRQGTVRRNRSGTTSARLRAGRPPPLASIGRGAGALLRASEQPGDLVQLGPLVPDVGGEPQHGA